MLYNIEILSFLSHYFVHGGWFDDPEYILNNADKLRNIPCTIVQGRYDLVTPMKTAWELHQVLLTLCFCHRWRVKVNICLCMENIYTIG